MDQGCQCNITRRQGWISNSFSRQWRRTIWLPDARAKCERLISSKQMNFAGEACLSLETHSRATAKNKRTEQQHNQTCLRRSLIFEELLFIKIHMGYIDTVMQTNMYTYKTSLQVIGKFKNKMNQSRQRHQQGLWTVVGPTGQWIGLRPILLWQHHEILQIWKAALSLTPARIVKQSEPISKPLSVHAWEFLILQSSNEAILRLTNTGAAECA